MNKETFVKELNSRGINCDEPQLNLITEYFKKNYGCEGITIKEIK